MARRRLTPAQPGYLKPVDSPAPPIAQVAGQSAEAAALREVTARFQAARDEGRMVVEIPLDEIDAGHLLRDRVAVGGEDLDALKASLAAHGQRTPAEVTPLPEADVSRAKHRYGLISGWRRLQALAALRAETGEDRFGVLRALVRPAADAGAAYTAMVEENEIRVGLSYYERARLVAETTKAGVFADQSEALRTLFAAASRSKRSKIASFIDIHEALGDVLVFPAEIPERLGLALVGRLRLGGRIRIRQALTRAAPDTAAAELAVLERQARAPKPDVSRAKHPPEEIAPGLTLAAKRSGQKLTLVLEGEGVDDGLLERLRAALRDPA